MLVFVGAQAAIPLPSGPSASPSPTPSALLRSVAQRPYLQAGMGTWFGAAGNNYFGLYTIILLLVSAVTVVRLRETRGMDLSTV